MLGTDVTHQSWNPGRPVSVRVEVGFRRNARQVGGRGLIILTACWTPACTARPTGPTFNRDIAPLVWQHCSGCHRPGQQAPFSLLTVQDLSQRARLIVDATGRHIMPPWLPESNYGAFAGERRLRSEEVELIARWLKDGMPEGDPPDRRAPPA